MTMMKGWDCFHTTKLSLWALEFRSRSRFHANANVRPFPQAISTGTSVSTFLNLRTWHNILGWPIDVSRLRCIWHGVDIPRCLRPCVTSPLTQASYLLSDILSYFYVSLAVQANADTPYRECCRSFSRFRMIVALRSYRRIVISWYAFNLSRQTSAKTFPFPPCPVFAGCSGLGPGHAHHT